MTDLAHLLDMVLALLLAIGVFCFGLLRFIETSRGITNAELGHSGFPLVSIAVP